MHLAGDKQVPEPEITSGVASVIPRISKVRHTTGYKLALKFNDGSEGEIDLEGELWGAVFEPMKDQKRFKNATAPSARAIALQPSIISHQRPRQLSFRAERGIQNLSQQGLFAIGKVCNRKDFGFFLRSAPSE